MLFSQAPVRELPASLTFAGKTALVTGANSGLGFSASLHFLQHRISTLILGVRTAKNGESAKSLLLADPIVKSLSPQPQILIYQLDLTSSVSVAAFATKITDEVSQLDIAVLNAGIYSLDWNICRPPVTNLPFRSTISLQLCCPSSSSLTSPRRPKKQKTRPTFRSLVHKWPRRACSSNHQFPRPRPCLRPIMTLNCINVSRDTRTPSYSCGCGFTSSLST